MTTTDAKAPALPTPVDREAALNTALAKAQGEFPPIKRDKIVSTGTYTFAYAPLDAILEAVRPILAKHKLALTQQLATDLGDRPSLRTELRHADGGMIAAGFPLGHIPDTPQKLGSLLTYLRRYAIVAILGIATEEDDDGQAAAGKTEGVTFQAPANTGTDRSALLHITEPQHKKIRAQIAELRHSNEQLYSEANVKAQLQLEYEVGSIKDLSRDDARDLIDRLQRTIDAQALGAE